LKKLLLPALLALLQACATQAPQPESLPEPAQPPVPPVVVEPPPAKPAPAKPAPAVAIKPPPAAPAPVTVHRPPPPPKPQPDAVVELPPAPRPGAPVAAAAAPEDLWERIRKGFAIPDLKGPLVRRKTAEYAAQPEYLQRIFDRSRLYLYHIVEEIEKRGLPTELALLPMVESAFNPMAYSRAHASGLWQFIPGTGKRFELEQNWWYDGRRGIVESTNAALDYLTKLYRMHGDWHLALASYNWGENNVKRAVAKNRAARKSTSYSSLKMPRETQQYLPKLQALKNIIADPEPYSIDLRPIPNLPYFATLTETPDMDVEQAARLAEMPVAEFIALNPGFSRPLIRSSTGTRIVLPADKVELFYANLEKQEGSLVSWQVYHPRPGEKLADIAKKFDLSIAELRRVNGIANGSSRVPRILVVPMNGEAKSALAMPIMYAPPIPVYGRARAVHVVKQGDTLGSIAARYRVSVAALKSWNQTGRFLQVGQKIYIR
jgi:membrane-bound lytic murein transglycosylase D